MLGSAAGIALLLVGVELSSVDGLARLYFVQQDRVVALLAMALIVAFAFGRLPTWAPVLTLTGRRVAVLAVVLALLLWLGTYALFGNYPLTRDEHMVGFDMAVLEQGQLAAPLAPEWRAYATAMLPDFGLDLPGDAAWVSAYMPGNAALRLAFSQIADPALMNPMLAAAGAGALFDVARRLFPDDRGAQAAAVLLYFSSAQMLATAMTPYAMTGHLALNLVWLALFLRGGWAGHGGAMLIGAVAVGLHQVIFHPLFVAPFMLLLLRRGAWRTTACYVVVYGAIGLFWVSYPALVAASAGLEGSRAAAGAGGFFAERVLPLLANRNPDMLALTGYNVLRFFTWQNLALLPLLVLARPAMRQPASVAEALALGLVLTLVMMAVLLPYQGHGWGYRYLHGLIGSAALLGAYGWQRLEGDQAGAGRQVLACGTALTIVIALPFLTGRVHGFVEPHHRVDAALEAIDADLVIVNAGARPFIVDAVRNQPDLSNRPLRLSSNHLDVAAVQALCRRGRTAFFGIAELRALGIVPEPHLQASRAFDRLKAACGRGQPPPFGETE